MKPSADYLRSIFTYNRRTGIVTRKVATSPRVKVGDVVGSRATSGHLQVNVYGKLRQLHHVIWCMETGEWPADQIDHKDGVRFNNRWHNLREATHAQNMQNVERRSSESGLTGVVYDPRRAKYRAYIGHEGKQKHIGYFSTAGEAHAAYLQKRKELHTFQPTPRHLERKK